MLKYVFCAVGILLFCGCSSVFRMQYPKPLPLTEKDAAEADKMSQILGSKHESALILSVDELEFALQNRKYFADAVKMSGFSAVAIPFADSADADVDSERGREICNFIMFLNDNGLRTFYLLRESYYINRNRGRRFIWGKGNPYFSTLLNLKKLWRKLPESAEMPTVIIALEMNRWNDKNIDRPAGLLFVWRNDKKTVGSSTDRMFVKSLQYFAECRELLDLEQLILLADEEVVTLGEQGGLSDGRIVDLLKKCDALAIDFVADEAVTDLDKRLNMLKKIKDNGSVFVMCSPDVKNIMNYQAWLEYLKKWQDNAGKISGCAGVWIRDWKKMNMIWRNEK